MSDFNFKKRYLGVHEGETSAGQADESGVPPTPVTPATPGDGDDGLGHLPLKMRKEKNQNLPMRKRFSTDVEFPDSARVELQSPMSPPQAVPRQRTQEELLRRPLLGHSVVSGNIEVETDSEFDSQQYSEGEELYCVCRQPYDPSKFMVECEKCKEWYHGFCIGLREGDIGEDDEWMCGQCVQEKKEKAKQRRAEAKERSRSRKSSDDEMAVKADRARRDDAAMREKRLARRAERSSRQKKDRKRGKDKKKRRRHHDDDDDGDDDYDEDDYDDDEDEEDEELDDDDGDDDDDDDGDYRRSSRRRKSSRSSRHRSSSRDRSRKKRRRRDYSDDDGDDDYDEYDDDDDHYERKKKHRRKHRHKERSRSRDRDKKHSRRRHEKSKSRERERVPVRKPVPKRKESGPTEEEEPRYDFSGNPSCANEECVNPSGYIDDLSSRYCSEECARTVIEKQIIDGIIARNDDTSPAYAALFKEIKDLEVAREAASAQLHMIATEKKAALDKKLEASNGMRPADDESPGADTYIDCVTCHSSVLASKYAPHALVCYAKAEHGLDRVHVQTEADGEDMVSYVYYYDSYTGGFRKKIVSDLTRRSMAMDADVCGCPLGPTGQDGLCAQGSKCPRHAGWRKIEKDRLYQAKVDAEYQLALIDIDERLIRRRIVQQYCMNEFEDGPEYVLPAPEDSKPEGGDGEAKPEGGDGDVKPEGGDGEAKPEGGNGDVKPDFDVKMEDAGDVVDGVSTDEKADVKVVSSSGLVAQEQPPPSTQAHPAPERTNQDEIEPMDQN